MAAFIWALSATESLIVPTIVLFCPTSSIAYQVSVAISPVIYSASRP